MVYIVLGVGGGVDVERRGFIFVWTGCFEVKVRKVKRVSLKYQFGVKKNLGLLMQFITQEILINLIV